MPKSGQKTPDLERRSDCPLNIALEVFGDSWTLLIIRDLLFKQYSTFKDFQQSREGIASNILADRLRKLVQGGFIEAERSDEDRRVVHYRPTPKGLDLAPVLISMMAWTDKHEKHCVPKKQMRRMIHHSEAVIAEIVEQFEGV